MAVFKRKCISTYIFCVLNVLYPCIQHPGAGQLHCTDCHCAARPLSFHGFPIRGSVSKQTPSLHGLIMKVNLWPSFSGASTGTHTHLLHVTDNYIYSQTHTNMKEHTHESMHINNHACMQTHTHSQRHKASSAQLWLGLM